jgi:hypothetical protein
MCRPIPDDAPVIDDGPFVAAGSWPLLSGSSASPTYLSGNVGFLWTFSDDYASCSGPCTHAAEYSLAGSDSWTALTVNTDPTGEWYARVDLPITELQNATTYAFRFTVTDCAGQTTQSDEYYFRVAVTDAPPVFTTPALIADGAWNTLPAAASRAPVLRENTSILWGFDDDYASCGGLCTHRARYKLVEDTQWTWIDVSTDPTGAWYAYTGLPVDSLVPGTYQFYFDVRDCAGQLTKAPRVYYFKVE